mmetsp:Transcript_33956/g.44805  ORF Transcript_33956/g.44805 Transcript_33956/m.44805 type:complete len:572 (-) Transcript_33956:192-1907(-)|eukprot:CAMPEP_0117753590 /NCGR_PEP_ID=MMETSP0947-20121206/12322_1 /TAXON_ID=44440 /ORGANISM="Chattonella subsalsa, Strain CCMP2191" /LENGTH=571 /DNA_ID=CAMNT_0005572513 /DNA_START=53 /DNA_END=1768 /DNA_ORIENTATION=-
MSLQILSVTLAFASFTMLLIPVSSFQNSHSTSLKISNPFFSKSQLEFLKSQATSRSFLQMSFDAKSWENSFKNAEELPLIEAPVVQGTIPEGFVGTYYRNGPGRFDNVLNPEDGDGFLSALTFHEGKAIFRGRFLKSIPYLKEKAKGQRLYRQKHQIQGGLFGPGGDLRSKNVGNTNLMFFSKRLLALHPTGLPYKIEPLSLSCQERTDIGEQLPDKGMFCAFPKVDKNTGNLISFVLNSDRKKAKILEFNSKYIVVSERTESFNSRLFTDDFAVTKNYYIFFEPAVNFDGGAYGFNRKSFAEACEFDSSVPTKVHLIPRDLSQKRTELLVDPMFLLSIGNAYEDESGNVIIDMVKTSTLPWADSSSTKPSWVDIDWSKEDKQELCRLTIQKGGNCEFSSLSAVSCASPFINNAKVGLPYQYLYATSSRADVSSPPECGLVKINAQTGLQEASWFPSSGSEFVGECTFVEKENDSSDDKEDYGWIVSTMRDTATSTSKIVIFDASMLQDGPVCSIEVGYLPKGSSGSFAKVVSFSLDEISRASKLSETFELNRWNEVESSFSGLGIRASDF